MTKSKKKTIPAGKDSKINITYTEFAANQERTELVVGAGKEFDNDTLLEILGFEKDTDGILRLQVEEHHIDKDNNGKKVRIKDKKIIRMNRNVVPIREEEQEENEIA